MKTIKIRIPDWLTKQEITDLINNYVTEKQAQGSLSKEERKFSQTLIQVIDEDAELLEKLAQ